MAALMGPIRIPCPVCKRPLAIPTTSVSGPRKITITLDIAYLRAHSLTHGSHDGQPLDMAA